LLPSTSTAHGCSNRLHLPSALQPHCYSQTSRSISHSLGCIYAMHSNHVATQPLNDPRYFCNVASTRCTQTTLLQDQGIAQRTEDWRCIYAMHSNHVATRTVELEDRVDAVASTRCTQTTLLPANAWHCSRRTRLHLRDALKPRCYSASITLLF